MNDERKRRVSRRGVLKGAVAGGVAWLGSTVFGEAPLYVFAQDRVAERDVLVVVFQRGGVDGLSVVVPYGEAGAYYDVRPTTALPEGGLHDLDGFFGLHPKLGRLHEVFQGGHLAVVHAAGSPDPSRSHFDAMEGMERGTPGLKTTPTGWLARHLESTPWTNSSPFRAISLGTMVQSALRGPVPALALKSIADFHLTGRDDQLGALQQTLAQLYRTGTDAPLAGAADETFRTVDALSTLAGESYTPEAAAAYPESSFGNALKQVAQLIKAQVGLEVACVDAGGWDTHEEQGGADGWLGGLISDFGAALSAFYTDLHAYHDRLTVVTMSEFGRRVTENASRGTDHGHGNVMFVMGGGVRGGVHTRWPGLGPDALDDGDLAVTTDYRDVLAEVLGKRLGNSALEQVFLDYTPTPGGIVTPRRFG